MLAVQSIMGCGPTFDKLLRAELRAKLLRGGLRAKLLRDGPSYCGEGRTTGQDVSTFVVRAGCGPSY